MILYHGTSVEGLEGIIAEGCLVPNKLNSSRAVEDGWAEREEHDGYLFFTDQISDAIHYASYAAANGRTNGVEPMIVLAFELEDLPVELANDHGWVKEYRTKESISKEHVREVLICDFETEAVIFRFSLDKWGKLGIKL